MLRHVCLNTLNFYGMFLYSLMGFRKNDSIRSEQHCHVWHYNGTVLYNATQNLVATSIILRLYCIVEKG